MSAKPQYDLTSIYLDGYIACDKNWKKKIKKKIKKYNTYGEQPYADETINNIVISELKELLKGEKTMIEHLKDKEISDNEWGTIGTRKPNNCN